MEMEAVLSKFFGLIAVYNKHDEVDNELECDRDAHNQVKKVMLRHVATQVHEHSQPSSKGQNETDDSEKDHHKGHPVDATGRQVKGGLVTELVYVDGLLALPECPVALDLYIAQCDLVRVRPIFVLDLPPEPWYGERDDEEDDREEGNYHKNAVE